MTFLHQACVRLPRELELRRWAPAEQRGQGRQAVPRGRGSVLQRGRGGVNKFVAGEDTRAGHRGNEPLGRMGWAGGDTAPGPSRWQGGPEAEGEANGRLQSDF